MKSWYSKENGWVYEKPDDWMVPKKTSDGNNVFIGDSVRVYHKNKKTWNNNRKNNRNKTRSLWI